MYDDGHVITDKAGSLKNTPPTENVLLACSCKGDDDKKEPAPVCACPITAANANGDDAIPVIDPVYRPEASFVPHSEMYREHGHAKVPAAKALQAAGLPETTPEEKDELEAYKDKKSISS